MMGSGPDFGLTFGEGVVPLTFFYAHTELIITYISNYRCNWQTG